MRLKTGLSPKDAVHYRPELDRRFSPKPEKQGERNRTAKLTDAQADEIRRRASSGEKGVALAKEYGVTTGTVSNIKNGVSRTQGVAKAPRPKREKVEFNGESLSCADWARRMGMSKGSLGRRIKKWGLDRALTTPKGAGQEPSEP